MKREIYTLSSLILILLGCSTENNNLSDERDPVDSIKKKDSIVFNKTTSNSTIERSNINFDEYLKSLDQISLPLKHNSVGHLPEISNDYDKHGFEKYSYNGTSKPLGILYNDGNTITLVDCSIGDYSLVPFFTTYDKLGNKIDSLGPYKKSGEGEGYYAIEYITIQSNKTIIVEDTVITWPAQEDQTELNQKISTERIKYTFEKDGRILKGK
jgi:hypothetical protein